MAKPVHEGAEAGTATRADPALVKSLARAHRWQRMLDEGRHASISEMAAVEKVDRGYLCRILQLTLLAPDIVEAVLDGMEPADLAFPALLKPFPADWERQRGHGFAAARSGGAATARSGPRRSRAHVPRATAGTGARGGGPDMSAPSRQQRPSRRMRPLNPAGSGDHARQS